jgi:hypothetical protein
MQGLVSHVDTALARREDLLSLAVPAETPTFRPISHHTLVSALDSSLAYEGIRITDEQFAIRRDGSAIFGVLKLAYGQTEDGTAMLGLRTSNDKSMAIQICAGLSVFVCDNMCFRGDMIALTRKHTSGLDLGAELTRAIGRFKDHIGILHAEVSSLKARALTDGQAKEHIYDVFARGIMPSRLLAAVGTEYFGDDTGAMRHEAFRPRTAWSLHNAFTEAAKSMPVTTRVPAIQAVGRYFGMAAA